MTKDAKNHLLSEASELISSVMGLHFPESRMNDLERNLASAAHEFGFRDTESFKRWLLINPLSKDHIEKLASHLTVGETYFFREKENFAALEEHILPELIRLRQGGERRLRIWSAGSSTGEEPYSIAILLRKLIADLNEWNITILATEINPVAIKKAVEGIYTEWSFRGTAAWVKEGYFRKTKDGRHRINPQIKDMVTFSYLNLAEDVYPSLLNNTNAMDLIICRNVLMYFSPKHTKRVIHSFYNCLMDKGWLMVSPTEAFDVISTMFTAVNFTGATVFRKDARRAETTQAQVQTEVYQAPVSVAAAEKLPASIGYAVRPEAGKPGKKAPDKTLYTEAAAAFEKGQYNEAVKRLEALSPEGEENAKASILLSQAYANQGRLEKAARECEKAIAADILNAQSHYLHAIILQEQGHLDEAAGALRKAIYLNHDFALAYFVLGNIMGRLGKHRRSKKHLKAARGLLSSYKPEDVPVGGGGITAGRFLKIISTKIQ